MQSVEELQLIIKDLEDKLNIKRKYKTREKSLTLDIKKYRHDYYMKNLEKNLEYRKKYYKDNKEEISSYYEKKKKDRQKYASEYYEKNKEAIKEKAKNSYHKKKMANILDTL